MQSYPSKKILLLSVSVGAGHVRAAEAIQAAALSQAVEHTVCHIDVMDYVSANFRKIYSDLYVSKVGKHPFLWRYLYEVSNEASPEGWMQRSRRIVERLNTRRLLREIDIQNPDIIICTHFLPAEILSRTIAKNSKRCPVWVQVTDFDLHRMWVVPNMSGYFVASEEVKYRLMAQGIPESQVHVTGIPIMPVFAQRLERSDCARNFNIDASKPTILLMGGGAGIGSLDSSAERLLSIEGEFQLIVLAGRNKSLLGSLRRLEVQFPQRLFAYGYTDRVEQLMACSDFVITKGGGLTVSECLAMGLAMIINTPIPGQEERNTDFLLENGAALKAIDSVTLEYRVRHLLSVPKKLQDMRASARAIGKPNAAESILEIILS